MNSLETSEEKSAAAEPVGEDQLSAMLSQLSKVQLLGAELFHTNYGTGRILAMNEADGELEVWFKGVVRLLVPLSAISSYPWMVDFEQFTVLAPADESISNHVDPETYERTRASSESFQSVSKSCTCTLVLVKIATRRAPVRRMSVSALCALCNSSRASLRLM